jgi:hypothetical protein
VENKNIEVGKIYNVDHRRKGKFVAQVTAINGEWIDAVIVEGIAKAICDYNVAYEGEAICMRDSLVKLTLKEVA